MMIQIKHTKQKQRGTVLVLSLIILSILTLVAVTGMQSSINEEKMSGNLRNHELAFQAAEGATRIAFNTIDGWVNISDITGTDGLLLEETAEPDYKSSATWATAGAYTPTTAIGNGKLAAVPKFVIKYVDNRDPCNEQNGLTATGTKQPIPPCPSDIYRVTGHGTGLTADTTVTIQAYYGRAEF